MKLLDNKTAVISGTNRGIGKSILELFAKNNCNIFACAREASEEFSDFMFSFLPVFPSILLPTCF